MRSEVAKRMLAETPKETKIFARWYGDLIVLINTVLKEKGYSQKTLAEKMDKRPSEINKWLKGDHNFTLRSLAKLQAELGEILLEVPAKKLKTEYVSNKTEKNHFYVAFKRINHDNSKFLNAENATEETNYSSVG